MFYQLGFLKIVKISFCYYVKNIVLLLYPYDIKPYFLPLKQLFHYYNYQKGNKISSAQITDYYKVTDLIGKQIMAVCNFGNKNIAGIVSEVLVLGAIEEDGKVVLFHPSQKVKNGLKIA